MSFFAHTKTAKGSIMWTNLFTLRFSLFFSADNITRRWSKLLKLLTGEFKTQGSKTKPLITAHRSHARIWPVGCKSRHPDQREHLSGAICQWSLNAYQQQYRPQEASSLNLHPIIIDNCNKGDYWTKPIGDHPCCSFHVQTSWSCGRLKGSSAMAEGNRNMSIAWFHDWIVNMNLFSD